MSKKQLLEEFIVGNIDSAYRFAYSYTKNTLDAEDVVNESVVKALKHINKLTNPEQIKTWFYRIIINTAKTNFSSKNKNEYLDVETLENLTPVYDDYSEINFRIIIEHLDAELRTIIVLRFLERMKLNEIANVLELNENTVKTKLYKGLKLLRVEMEGDYDEIYI